MKCTNRLCRKKISPDARCCAFCGERNVGFTRDDVERQDADHLHELDLSVADLEDDSIGRHCSVCGDKIKINLLHQRIQKRRK